MATLLTPQTGSTLTGPNGRDATLTGLSTNIVIRRGNLAVGAIQNLSLREQRTITMFDELSTDGHIDSAPTKSTDISGECRRIRYERMRMTEAFGCDFLHVHAQRIPFDIDIYDNWNGDGSNAIITTIHNIWIESMGYNYDSQNWVIIDDMSFKAEAISSSLNGGNAATGGLRGSQILQINSTELLADVGAKRGSLDVPGLITDFFSNV